MTCQEAFPKVTRDPNLVQDEIPDESFSSSDDDDDRYFDAEDETRLVLFCDFFFVMSDAV